MTKPPAILLWCAAVQHVVGLALLVVAVVDFQRSFFWAVLGLTLVITACVIGNRYNKLLDRALDEQKGQ